MAYTSAQTAAQVITAVQSANSNALYDQVNNALSAPATGAPTPIGTPVLLWGVLVKCTTGYGTTLGGTTPVYAYDSSPA
jgi:hypothetical protein